MARQRETAQPIVDGPTWLHIPSGWFWREDRFHRGRVVLKRIGNHYQEIRLYRPEDDPGTGGAVLSAPTWIKHPAPVPV